MIIAVSGKGGVGKTAIAALLIKHYAEDKLNVLAIDADPDTNLPGALGIKEHVTIGEIREEILQRRDRAPGRTLREVVEYHMFDAVTETDDFDLIVMGRAEGQGCYCAINHILREIIDTWSKSYDRVIIDCEAGLEHLSRRTTADVDVMLIVVDSSKRSIETALRIREIADELDIKFKHIFVVINRVSIEEGEEIKKRIESNGLKVIGIIPYDETLKKYDLAGKPLVELPQNSTAVEKVKEIKEEIEKNIAEVEVKRI